MAKFALGTSASLKPTQDFSGHTTLHLATRTGHTGTAELLLLHDGFTEINALSMSGRTALHYVSTRNDTGMTKLLIGHKGTIVNAKDVKGHSACTLQLTTASRAW